MLVKSAVSRSDSRKRRHAWRSCRLASLMATALSRASAAFPARVATSAIGSGCLPSSVGDETRAAFASQRQMVSPSPQHLVSIVVTESARLALKPPEMNPASKWHKGSPMFGRPEQVAHSVAMMTTRSSVCSRTSAFASARSLRAWRVSPIPSTPIFCATD